MNTQSNTKKYWIKPKIFKLSISKDTEQNDEPIQPPNRQAS